MTRPFLPAIASVMLFLTANPVSSAPGADITCAWDGSMGVSPSQPHTCFDGGRPGPVPVLPANTDRMMQDGLTLCRSEWNPAPKDADIVFIMDNSGSMEKGENSGGFNTPPGDPFGVRDRVIRRSMVALRGQAGTATAGFLSFYGLGGNQDYTVEPEIETEKTQRPLDISLGNPQGEANLDILMRKVWKHNPNEALLPKAGSGSREAKKALTFWSEALSLARDWFRPDSGFTRSGTPAIILVSDGAIGDWGDVQKLIPTLPPVYGIHLGQDANAQHLKDLATLTRGSYRLVSPTDTLAFGAAMLGIIANITHVTLPGSVQVTRGAQGPIPPVTVKSAGLGIDRDGNLRIRLEKDLSLVPGDNHVHILYERVDAKVERSFPLQVSGPAPTVGNPHFTCADPAGIRPLPVTSSAVTPAPPSDRDALGKKRLPASGKAKAPVRLYRAAPEH